jgi:hypothetical protein
MRNEDGRINAKRDKLRLAATTMDLCAGYQGDNDPGDAPKWRVPNQRELTLINLFENTEHNKFTTTLNTAGWGYLSSTKYSNAVNASINDKDNFRYSYVIEKSGLFALVIMSPTYAIRCVRDLAPSESNGSTPPSTDGDGEYGGGI